jgi:CRISPR/Cas system-associated endoribonuclease Cas2
MMLLKDIRAGIGVSTVNKVWPGLCLQIPYQHATTQNKGKYMDKLIYGVGVNDLPYRVQINEYVTENGGKRIQKSVFRCKYYSAWVNMLERCYSKKYLESYPSYIGTSVCNKWLSATAFKKWMEQQDWQGKSLDKDIIAPGSKLYSTDKCAFVLPATNSFVTARDASRGDYPIGVSLFKPTGKYIAQCKNPTGKLEHLGYFSTPEEAHEAWRKRKHELAQLVAARESDPRVVEALRKRYSLEEWYKSITYLH